MIRLLGVEHWIENGGAILTDSNQTPNTDEYSVADRLWVLRSIVERETAQTTS